LLAGVDKFILCSVVEILELFNHPSEELKISLQRHVDLFNPRDYNYSVSHIDTYLSSVFFLFRHADDDGEVDVICLHAVVSLQMTTACFSCVFRNCRSSQGVIGNIFLHIRPSSITESKRAILYHF